MSVVPSLLDTTVYSCWIALTIDSREPETQLESLLCAEAPEWRRARKRERDALFERQVMRIVPTSPGARPIKSRYVYKRKTTRIVWLKSIRHA